MVPEPKKRKIGSKTYDCMFIGYVNHSAAYIFLVLRSEVLDYNVVIEIKNVEFFKNIFPLSQKISHIPTVRNNFENTNEVLRKSKRQKKNISFENDFYTYLVDNDLLTYFDAISSSNAPFEKAHLKLRLI